MEKRKETRLAQVLHRLLLRLPPEMAHDLGLGALSLVGRRASNYLGSCRVDVSCLRQEVLGCRFPNPLGLAAGFDKNGRAISGLEALGFGSIEVGTVTRRPQVGNPKPRLFRHRSARSLENAMGFNNAGAEALVRRLQRLAERDEVTVPLGVNLGKNKTTPNEEAVSEYAALAAVLDGYCDYFVINVSSPNTPGLRDLQSSTTVQELLEGVREATSTPILVKLSPDLDTGLLVELATTAVASGAAGVILTNTTIDYQLLPQARRIGGLSGKILAARSYEVLRAVAAALRGRTVLVSVGGIDTGREAYRRILAGATLVQVYSALAYRGPFLVAEMLGELVSCLERDGFDSLTAAVGADLSL